MGCGLRLEYPGKPAWVLRNADTAVLTEEHYEYRTVNTAVVRVPGTGIRVYCCCSLLPVLMYWYPYTLPGT